MILMKRRRTNTRMMTSLKPTHIGAHSTTTIVETVSSILGTVSSDFLYRANAFKSIERVYIYMYLPNVRTDCVCVCIG